MHFSRTSLAADEKETNRDIIIKGLNGRTKRGGRKNRRHVIILNIGSVTNPSATSHLKPAMN